MACPDQNFQADFFNNVAAIAVVLIFAKVYAHRSRHRGPHDAEPSAPRARFHGLAVTAAAVAAAVALLATEDATDRCIYHLLAGGGLVISGIILVGEILHDDLPAVKRRWLDLRQRFRKSPSQQKSD